MYHESYPVEIGDLCTMWLIFLSGNYALSPVNMSIPEGVLGEESDDARFVTPGTPRGAWIGIRISAN